jgi:hypothetical protein
VTVILDDRFVLRRGTSADLATVNEVPLEGEIVYETDQGLTDGKYKVKIGDGSTHYNDLPYFQAGGLPSGGTVGQVLTKLSGIDGDADWQNVTGGGTLSLSSLYQLATDGAWFSVSDASSLFQDAAGTTPAVADGDPVGLIRDKSGFHNDATQSTSSARPVLRLNGGDPYLEFSGSQWLSVPSSVLSLSGFEAGFAVRCRASSTSGLQPIIARSYAASATGRYGVFISSGNVQALGQITGSNTATASVLADTSDHLYTCRLVRGTGFISALSDVTGLIAVASGTGSGVANASASIPTYLGAYGNATNTGPGSFLTGRIYSAAVLIAPAVSALVPCAFNKQL